MIYRPSNINKKHLVSPISHVRTTGLTLMQNASLQENLQKGLNHIPLKTSWFNEVICEIILAWEQLCECFSISGKQVVHGMRWLMLHSRQKLQGRRVNFGGIDNHPQLVCL